jgi:hypothetical protein
MLRSDSPLFVTGHLEMDARSTSLIATLVRDRKHIRNMNRCLFLQSPALRIPATGTHVAINHVYALHENQALVTVHTQHLAALSLVIPGDHFDFVISSNVACHVFNLTVYRFGASPILQFFVTPSKGRFR